MTLISANRNFPRLGAVTLFLMYEFIGKHEIPLCVQRNSAYKSYDVVHLFQLYSTISDLKVNVNESAPKLRPIVGGEPISEELARVGYAVKRCCNMFPLSSAPALPIHCLVCTNLIMCYFYAFRGCERLFLDPRFISCRGIGKRLGFTFTFMKLPIHTDSWRRK